MNQPQENQKPVSCCNKREMILAFAIPFLLVGSAWTIIDYIDVSDGLEKERDAGVTTKVPESELWLHSLQKSLLLALPAGALGLGGFVIFKKNKS